MWSWKWLNVVGLLIVVVTVPLQLLWKSTVGWLWISLEVYGAVYLSTRGAVPRFGHSNAGPHCVGTVAGKIEWMCVYDVVSMFSNTPRAKVIAQ
jgi:hypothetical protein